VSHTAKIVSNFSWDHFSLITCSQEESCLDSYRSDISAMSFARKQLTRWSRVLFQKLTVTQLVRKFPFFYGTRRRFITVFTRAYHWSLSWARCTQSTLAYPIPLRSILILSYHLRLCLRNNPLPFRSSDQNFVHIFRFPVLAT